MGAVKRSARRSSFVVTVTLAAATGACGGNVGGSGTGSGGAGGSGGNPPACPSSLPELATSCGSVGLECQYSDGTDACGQERVYRASCAPDGAWDISQVGPTTSCNPPPPPMPCPTAVPTAGNWCNVDEGEICSFPSDCCPIQYQCLNSVWQQLTTPCDPPQPVCPSTRPAQGEPCNASCGGIFSCDYDECLINAQYFTATCNAGAWSVVETPCVGGG
jgi:hypothetical protein